MFTGNPANLLLVDTDVAPATPEGLPATKMTGISVRPRSSSKNTVESCKETSNSASTCRARKMPICLCSASGSFSEEETISPYPSTDKAC